MKKITVLLAITFSALITFAQWELQSQIQTSDTLQVHFSVTECDSLIQANSNNPDFVIIDVRRPEEHIPQHLQGAINRDYYAEDFVALIDSLPRQKMYVLYCKTGGRSGQAFNLMASMDFTSIANMLGGINAWVSESLPTTSEFEPLLMAVSDSVVPMDTVAIGTIDTINLTVTNRANDTLRFNAVTLFSGSEFSTDFDTTTFLLGAEDYTFSIYYNPENELKDSLELIIESNGGDLTFRIYRTGITPVFENELSLEGIIKTFPNPFTASTTIEYELTKPSTVQLTIYDFLGKQVEVIEQKQAKGKQQIVWNAELLPAGVYFCILKTESATHKMKMIKLK